ncbi:hypothetical protein [uncultured Adlercreutzia sp.]|uniref:hypothetical protein n=1 Tax=uncultured Adlercreutzia sp. TaxID=875803 RepID=UPI0025FEE7F8|nr:hypothetical protein [uncultured Adlercreutzia sp.]
MREGVIFGRPVRMQGGPFALMAYRREFGADLLADALAAYRRDGGDVAAFLQIAWAMAKTADEETSPYAEWLREFDPREFTLGDAAQAVGVIDSAVAAELFRRGKARRARRWLARRMESLAHRLGARASRLLAG